MHSYFSLPKSVFICVFILIFNNIYGKSDFMPGYIIKHNGDTIHGLIEYKNWQKNPQTINFRLHENSIVNKYTSADIKEFKVSNEVFVSAVVKIDESKLSADALDFEGDLTLIDDTVFLEVIVQGSQSLYYYGTKSIKDQFYIKQDSTYELLIYKKYLDGKNSNYKENKRYISQLALYLKDCQGIQCYLTSVDYSKMSLERLFKQFYNCTNREVTFLKRTEKTSIQPVFLAGSSLTSLTFSGSGYSNLVLAYWNNSVNFAGGLSLNLVFPRNFNKLSFNNELLYTDYKVKGVFTDFKSEKDYTVYTSEIGLSYIKYNTMFRYNQPIAKAFIFLNAGLSFGFRFNETNSQTSNKVFYSETSTKESKALPDIRDYEMAYNIGLGSKFKKYSVEIRYEKGNGFSDFDNLKVKSDRLYFLLGYRF